MNDPITTKNPKNKEDKMERIDEIMEKYNMIPVANYLDYYSEPVLDILLNYLETFNSSDKTIEDEQLLENQVNEWESEHSFNTGQLK